MENKLNGQSLNENKIDVSYIITVLRRNWYLFAISTFVCILFAGVYLYRKHPVYSIHAKMLVSYDDGSGSMGSTLMKSLSLGGVGGNTVEDEVLVVNSHSIKAQAIKELKLNRSYSSPKNFLKTRYYYNDSPIEINAPDELFDTLSVGMSFKIKVNAEANKISVKVKKGMFKTLAEVEANKFPFVVSTPYGIFSVDTTKYYVPGEKLTVNVSVAGNSVLAEDYAQLLSIIKTEKKANGISLYMDDISIQRGTDILNKMIELYNRRGQAEKDEMAINTAKFIEERLAYLYKDLSASEAKIEQFKRDKKKTDVAYDTKILIEKTNSLERELVRAETEFEILNMTRAFISDPKNKYSLIPNATGLGAAGDAIESYNGLILERMKLSRNAKSNNATLISLNEQIDALRENIIVTLDKAYESASVRLTDLRSQTRKSQMALGDIPSQEREYLELEREQVIRNTLYSFLLQKREENQLVLAATTPKGKIVDEAYAFNEPIAPNKKIIVIMAFFFGLMMPAIWLYLKHMFSDKFESQDALARVTGLPILGEICHSQRAASDALVVSEKSTRPIAELFRLLRNNLQFMIPAIDTGMGKCIIVTSGCSGEGKTFISMNVAESLALIGKKVVLVGLDIRLPKLAENFKLPMSPGVTNYLSGAVDSVDELIRHYSKCDVIVAGPVPPNPSELLLTERLTVFIEDLKRRYDYVVIDSAPIGLVSDTFSLTKYSDVTLYVTRVNYTKRTFIKYLNNVVERGQLKNVAVVVNDTNPKLSSGYGYGYGSIGDE